MKITFKKYSIIHVLLIFFFAILWIGCEKKNIYTKEIAESLIKYDSNAVKKWMVQRGYKNDSIKRRELLDSNRAIGTRKVFHPLLFSEINSMHDVSEYLLDNYMEPNISIKNDLSLLFYASSYKLPQLVKLLVEKGANVNDRFSICCGYASPLSGALDNSADAVDTSETIRKEVIKLLLDHGAIPNPYLVIQPNLEMTEKGNKAGRNEPYGLVKYTSQNIEDMKLMLQYHANLKDNRMYEKISVLQLVVQWELIENPNDKSMTRFLIEEAHTDMEYKDEFGWTALHYAAMACNRGTVPLLLSLGANKRAQTTKERCPSPIIMMAENPPVRKCFGKGSQPINVLQISHYNDRLFGTSEFTECITCTQMLK